MIDESNQEELKQEVQPVDDNVPQTTEAINEPSSILPKLQEVTSDEKLREVANLFNLSIAKKEMIRAVQQDKLLDAITNQMEEKITKRPDEMSSKEMIDYMNAFQSNLDRTKGYATKVNENPTIQVNNDNKKVVVNISGLSRDSNENVIDAINEIIKEYGNKSPESLANLVDSVDIAEIDLTKESEEDAND